MVNTIYESKVQCSTSVFSLWDPTSLQQLWKYKTVKTGCKPNDGCKIMSS
jgi:hypothetical protein